LKSNDGKPSAAESVSARDWLAKAFEAGRLGEATTLAGLLLDENVGPTNPARAHQVLSLAANKGNAAAMIDLARLDFLGLGAPRDLPMAGNWTERADAAGRPDAYARLAALYRTDTADGRRPDFASAFLWAQKGTARNEPMAYYELGLLYEGGLGRPIDFAKAEENFGRAADLGYARATYELGLLWDAGHGRSTDLVRAASYFKRAADQGYVPAMIRYGQLAAAGRGTPRDDAAALVAFTKALQLGDADGYWQAALLTDAGRGGPRNPQRAASYILEAVQRGSAPAISALEGSLSDFSEDARRALKTLLLARGLVPVPSSGDSFGISEREALLASARSVR
jgi:TPR repeat protein